jgi:hypothetical protein
MGGLTSGSFKPGESPGRKPGSQNRVSYELRERLKKRGDKDPAEFLSGIVTNEQEHKELRIAAANVLMPYLYNKLAPISAPPMLIILEDTVSIPYPHPKTLLEARENIAYISDLKAQGQIDRAWAESLVHDQRALHDSLVDEANLIAADASTAPPVIRIEGGMPELPGSIIMPTQGPSALEHEPAAAHESITTSTNPAHEPAE